MPTLGPTELIIVLVLVIIVFGAGKLPEVGGALGKSIKEFRKTSTEDEEQAKEEAIARETERRQQEAKQAEIDREVEKRLQEREAARKE